VVNRLAAPILAGFRVGPKPPRQWLRQTLPDNCSQTVLSMLTGKDLAEITRLAGRPGALGISHACRVLEASGVHCGRPLAAQHAAEFWPVYWRRAGGRRLRGLGFRVARQGEDHGHAWLLFGNRLYDPADGEFRTLDPDAIRQLDWVVLCTSA